MSAGEGDRLRAKSDLDHSAACLQRSHSGLKLQGREACELDG